MPSRALPATPAARLVYSVALIIFVTLAVASLGALTDKTPDPIQNFPEFPASFLPKAWVHWDAKWYAEIAREGYSYSPGNQSTVAFFPLYPLTVYALTQLGLNLYWAGMLLSFCCGIGALVMFSKWAKLVSGQETLSNRATLSYAIYPYSLYLFGIMYSDALFLLLVISAFYFLEKRQLLWAVLFGALATSARPVAPAVLVGLMARNWEIRRSNQQPLRLIDFLPVLSAAGLAAYCTFLWWKFDHPFLFADVQAAPGWDHVMGWKSWLKMALWHRFAVGELAPGTWYRLLHGLFALSSLALAWQTGKKWGWGYAVYVLVVVGIPAVSSKDFLGLGRYTLAAFPVFLTLTSLLENRPRLRRGLALASMALLLHFAYRFSRGVLLA